MIISLANIKGGVGKSTLAVNLAVEAMKDGWQDVAVLELDPQRTAHLWSKLREQRGIQPPVEVELVETLKAIENGCAAYAGDKESLLLVDCSGADSQFNRVAVKHSDLVLIPTRPSQAEVFALERAVSLLLELGKTPYILNCGAFPQAVGTLNDLTDFVQETLPGSILLSTVVRYRAGFQHSFAEGKSVTEYSRDPGAAYEIRSLAKEINTLLGKEE